MKRFIIIRFSFVCFILLFSLVQKPLILDINTNTTEDKPTNPNNVSQMINFNPSSEDGAHQKSEFKSPINHGGSTNNQDTSSHHQIKPNALNPGGSIKLYAGATITSEPPSPFFYQEGTTGNELSWTAEGGGGGKNYQIYKNSSPIYEDPPSWTNNEEIILNIDGLQRVNNTVSTFYNYTIAVLSTGGNDYDTVMVNVTDTLAPIFIDPIFNYSYEVGSENKEIYWNISEYNANKYRIYSNISNNVSSGTYSNYSVITQNIDGLEVGTYNYTIGANDTLGHYNSSSIIVKVYEEDIPEFLQVPANSTFYESNITKNIEWNASDNFPDKYILLANGSQFTTGYWETTNNITININDLTSDSTYNLTLIIYDEVNNSAWDTIFVSIIDDIVPTIHNIQTYLTYNESGTENSIHWNTTDSNPYNYTIYTNSSTDLITGSWTSAENITLNIYGISKGVYNFTLIVEDTAQNQNSFTITIEIIDELAPSIIGNSGEISVKEGVSNQLSWNVTDNHSANFSIYLDNELFKSGNWTSTTNITIDISDFAKGEYNITLVVVDESDNLSVISVIVSVLDLTNPDILEVPSDMTINETTSEILLIWNVTDLYPGNYSILQDGVYIIKSSWSGNNISYLLPKLSKGLYNYTIIIYDESLNFISDEVFITVIDQTKPEITFSPDDITVIYGTEESIELEWTATDKYAKNYIIFENGSQKVSSNWISNTSVYYSLQDNVVGKYNISIVFIDESANRLLDTVFVTILPIPTSNPEITDINKIVQSGDIARIRGFWSTNTSEGISGADISVSILDGDIVLSLFAIQTTSNGSFSFTISYQGIRGGNYTLLMEFMKQNYEKKITEIPVQVRKQSVNIEITMSDNLVRGKEYIITISANYRGHSVLLDLHSIVKQNTGPITDLLIYFQFLVEWRKQSTSMLNSTLITDEDGNAYLTLPPETTQELDKILGINLAIRNNPYINDYFQSFDESQLPIVVNPNPNNSNDSFQLGLINIIFVIALLIITISLLALYYFNRKSSNKEKEEAHSEISFLKKTRGIFLKTTIDSLPVFEIKLHHIDSDLTAVAGLSSAISSFLSEIDDTNSIKTGKIEVIHREGITLTSFHGNNSILSIISRENISQIIIERIRKIHSNIEEEFQLELSDESYTPRSSIDSQKILDIFEQGKIRLRLGRKMTVNQAKIDEISENLFLRFEFNKILPYFELLPKSNEGNDHLSLESIFSTINEGVKDEEKVSKIIINGYKNNILIPA